MATAEQNQWLVDALGVQVKPASGGASTASNGTPQPKRPPAPAAGDYASLAKHLMSLADTEPSGLPPSALKAISALSKEFGKLDEEVAGIMKDLDNDDLGAIDRASALSRLGDIQGQLGKHLDAIQSSLS